MSYGGHLRLGGGRGVETKVVVGRRQTAPVPLKLRSLPAMMPKTGRRVPIEELKSRPNDQDVAEGGVVGFNVGRR